MRVPEFGVGFPPKLWGIRWGETEYTINALPLGGFVKIVGEDGTDTEDSHSFPNRPKILQALTLIAGPLANLFIGFVVFWIAFVVGIPAVEDDGATALTNKRVIAIEVVPRSPAADAGLKIGDTLLSATIDGKVIPIESGATLPKLVASSTGPLLLNVSQDDNEKQISLEPRTGVIVSKPSQRAIGLAATAVGEQKLGIMPAFTAALEHTYTATISIFLGLCSLVVGAFTFSASIGDLSGPVGIAGIVGDAAAVGLGQVLVITALISINLFIVNLLPFPALDGGRLVILAVETATQRRLPKRLTDSVNTIGFMLLLLLMLAVTVSDVFKLL